MGLFRKNPVVIEAFRFWSMYRSQIPDWAYSNPSFHLVEGDDPHIVIRTLEGDMRADIGDWIIKGIKGELYPCKPDIFAATYDAA